MFIQQDIDVFEERLRETFMTKEEFQKHKISLMNKLNNILSETIKSRATAHQSSNW